LSELYIHWVNTPVHWWMNHSTHGSFRQHITDDPHLYFHMNRPTIRADDLHAYYLDIHEFLHTHLNVNPSDTYYCIQYKCNSQVQLSELYIHRVNNSVHWWMNHSTHGSFKQHMTDDPHLCLHINRPTIIADALHTYYRDILEFLHV
jgi:hypothetical protein